MDTEPAIIPMIGSIPKALAIIIPAVFCTTIHTAQARKKKIMKIPPFLRTFKDAIKPMVVKKASIKNVCREPSKVMFKIL